MKKLLFFIFSISLTFSPSARPKQAKQLSLQDLQTIAYTINQLSDEDKSTLEQAALEMFNHASKEEKAHFFEFAELLGSIANTTIDLAAKAGESLSDIDPTMITPQKIILSALGTLAGGFLGGVTLTLATGFCIYLCCCVAKNKVKKS